MIFFLSFFIFSFHFLFLFIFLFIFINIITFLLFFFPVSGWIGHCQAFPLSLERAFPFQLFSAFLQVFRSSETLSGHIWLVVILTAFFFTVSYLETRWGIFSLMFCLLPDRETRLFFPLDIGCCLSSHYSYMSLDRVLLLLSCPHWTFSLVFLLRLVRHCLFITQFIFLLLFHAFPPLFTRFFFFLLSFSRFLLFHFLLSSEYYYYFLLPHYYLLLFLHIFLFISH